MKIICPCWYEFLLKMPGYVKSSNTAYLLKCLRYKCKHPLSIVKENTEGCCFLNKANQKSNKSKETYK